MAKPEAANSLFERGLSGLYAINFCAGMSMAVFGMLASTWMEQSGYPSLLIGVVSATYYLLQILGAPAAERLVRRTGGRSALAVGLACACLASPLFVLTHSPLLLGLVRGAAGFGVGICVTAAQTALVAQTDPKQRGMVSGLHALAFALGLALGPVIGPRLYEHEPAWAALFGSLVFAVALVVTLATVPAGVTSSKPQRFAVAAKIRAPLHAIFAYGFAESTLFSLYPPALVRRGTSVHEIGLILSTFVLGSIVFTMPVAHLGDRFGRQRVLAGCAAFGILSMLGLYTDSLPLTLLLATLAGGSVGSSYALTMALTADGLRAEEVPSGMALFTVALGAGCVAGPIVTGTALSLFPSSVLFVPTSLVFAALLPRLSLRTRVVPDAQKEYAVD